MPLRTRSNSRSLGRLVGLGLAFSLACASSLYAQVTVDPRIAEFSPSADHWQVLSDGLSAVSHYDLRFYLVGASTPLATINIGKPSPDADGKIRFDFATEAAAWSLPGYSYEARISAVGPQGEGVSDASNRFTFGTAQPCGVTLGSGPGPIPSPGGNYAVSVSTGTDCSWVTRAAVSWVTVRTPGGSGNGTVAFVVGANPSATSRTGALTIGSQILTIRQDGLRVPVISWKTPVPITEGTPLGASQLNAVADVSGGFVYNPAAGTVLPGGAHTLKAAFLPADPTRYAAVSASTSLTVNPGGYQLTVTRPTGGMVYGAGLYCGTVGTACGASMSASMLLGLTAAPDAGYLFSAWTGDCSGTNSEYWLLLNGVKSCGARFTALSTAPVSPVVPVEPPAGALPLGAPYTLTILRPWGGDVKAAGISCGAATGTCVASMPGPMLIGLQAVASPGYVFVQWTGHCTGIDAGHWLTLEGPRTCGATFAAAR